MDWFTGIGCGLAYLLGVGICYWQNRKAYETRLTEAHAAATVAYRQADVYRQTLAGLQEELRQERASRYIREENEKLRRSEIAKRGWEKRRTA